MKDETNESERCIGSGARESAVPELAQEKFTTLVRMHSGWVYAMARRQLGDPGLAEDAAQMVFLALWRKNRWFIGERRKIGGWLVRATCYACKDIRKMEARRKKRERRVAAMETEHGPSRHREAMETDQLLKLDAALQRLSATDRAILVARFFQDQKVCDVAEQMGISEAAAEKRISRAVDRLRKMMTHNNSEEGGTETAPVAGLLIAGAGPAPTLLVEKILQAAGCGVPAKARYDRAARRILRHTSHLSAVVGTTAAAIIVLVAVPTALRFQHTSASAVPTAPSEANGRKARWPGEKTGVLTCVAYGLLTQRDFAWAVETSGTLISGKSGGIRAYDLSARVVRALARSQTMRGTAFPFPPLRWLHAPFYSTVHYNGFAPSPLGFGGINALSSAKPFGDFIITNLEFHAHLRPYLSFLRVRVRFDSNSLIQPPAHSSIPYIYSGGLNIRPGHSVVLLRHVCTFQGKRWYSAVVFDVERYAYPIARKLPYMLDAFRYFRVGPAGFAKSAVISRAWNRYALAHPVAAAIPARWKKTFSNGATVAIAAINTHQWPLCSWTPDGQPLPDSQGEDAEIPLSMYSTVGGILSDGRPRRTVVNVLSHEEVVPNALAALFVYRLSQHAWAGLEWVQKAQPVHAVRVGLDYGKWRQLGTAVLSPHFRRYFLYRGHRLVWNQVSPQARGSASGSHNSINLFTQAIGTFSNRAFAVGAITLHGRLAAPIPAYNSRMARFTTSRGLADQEYAVETLSVVASNVKRYVWITRPRHWLTFPGTFKLQPSPRPDEVVQIEQRIRKSARVGRATRNTTLAQHEAANQATPRGLMELLRKYQDVGDREAIRKLFYAPTAFDQRAANWDIALWLQKTDYGLWTSALKRFGLNQMRAAGMFGIRPQGVRMRNPTHWNIQGQHAVPFYPLPAGTSWRALGQPMSRLIRRGGQWYLDCNLSSQQAVQVRRWMRQMAAYSVSERILSNAYRTVLKALNMGEIKDAYTLRDQVLAEIKKFRAAAK